MSLPLPTTLSPSKISAFKHCPLAFRFSVIDRLPGAAVARGQQGHAGPPGAGAAHARARRPTAPRRRPWPTWTRPGPSWPTIPSSPASV